MYFILVSEQLLNLTDNTIDLFTRGIVRRPFVADLHEVLARFESVFDIVASC